MNCFSGFFFVVVVVVVVVVVLCVWGGGVGVGSSVLLNCITCITNHSFGFIRWGNVEDEGGGGMQDYKQSIKVVIHYITGSMKEETFFIFSALHLEFNCAYF